MEVRVLQMLEGARAAEGLTVVIDVFRAFSLEAYLLAWGAERVIPVGDEALARRIKAENPDVLLVGERGGKRLEGFDGGNSPSELQHIDVRGKTVVHTTSAGTQGIANATGAEYDFLHACIRDFGHFAQYLLLGAFAYGTYFSFKGVGNWQFSFIPVCSVFFVASTDEYIQSLVPGRGAEFTDVMVDMMGCAVGFLIALAVFAIVCVSIKARKRRMENV